MPHCHSLLKFSYAQYCLHWLNFCMVFFGHFSTIKYTLLNDAPLNTTVHS